MFFKLTLTILKKKATQAWLLNWLDFNQLASKLDQKKFAIDHIKFMYSEKATKFCKIFCMYFGQKYG